MNILLRTVILFILILLLGNAHAQNSVRHYKLPNESFISFMVPESWDDNVEYSVGGYLMTITFKSTRDNNFKVLFSPF